MNYSQFTIDKLLKRVEAMEGIKTRYGLTQWGLDKANEELSAIEAELDSRKPEGEFVTLLDDDGLPVGFEYETN